MAGFKCFVLFLRRLCLVYSSKSLKDIDGFDSRPRWHNGYCGSLENCFPNGYPGSIPGLGVFLFRAYLLTRLYMLLALFGCSISCAKMKKQRKCLVCKAEFEIDTSAKYQRKYCLKCSKKRKTMWDDQWKVKFEDLADE